MESIFLLLPISLLLVVLIGVAFWWAVFSGQFDNTNRAAKSIILDDDDPVSDSNVPVTETDASLRKADDARKDDVSPLAVDASETEDILPPPGAVADPADGNNAAGVKNS